MVRFSGKARKTNHIFSLLRAKRAIGFDLILHSSSTHSTLF
ncbi:MAG: hypothetical protein U5L45_08850 [Saprospiraceae bacterium]|nr:hypothetical protein [Saprospiraceae bacterium]